MVPMSRAKRSDDWGFPRWRAYGQGREAQKVRLCDRHGCDAPGQCPAPKSPNSPERWYFCEAHAAEYNRGWDYFAGLSAEDAAARAAEEAQGRSADEMRALEVFGLDSDADFDAAKKAWRAYAKECHPDVKPGDADAAKRFAAGQAAFEVLKQAEDRKSWKPA